MSQVDAQAGRVGLGYQGPWTVARAFACERKMVPLLQAAATFAPLADALGQPGKVGWINVSW